MMRKFLTFFVLSGVCFLSVPRVALAAGCGSVFYDQQMATQYFNMAWSAAEDGDTIVSSEFLALSIYYQNQIYAGPVCVADPADPSENPDVTEDIGSLGD